MDGLRAVSLITCFPFPIATRVLALLLLEESVLKDLLAFSSSFTLHDDTTASASGT
jgi:hypothetical protein